MNFQTLRYLVQINYFGSLNKASRALYVSQSTLSRALKEAEEHVGFTIFVRTNKGVVPTFEGKRFLDRIGSVLQEIDDLENQYWGGSKESETSLLVATQRCSVIIKCFLDFYDMYCKDKTTLNLAIQETTTKEIIDLISNRIYHIGILYYTSDNEKEFLQMCRSLQLEAHQLNESPLCAQISYEHPLAKEVGITTDMLTSYPHVTFSDEDIPKINYCSDILQFNQNIIKKRIVVKSMGTLKQVLKQTDGYFIGCDFSDFNLPSDLGGDLELCYVPLVDAGITIKTIWIHRQGHYLSKEEKDFVDILQRVYQNPFGVSESLLQ